jgi:predicted small secreted protein
MKTKITRILLVTFVLVSAGCNTWSGFGKDLQKVGTKVQSQGDKVKD